MGRRGYVQTRQAEYGSAITAWCQHEAYDYLSKRHIDVVSCGDDMCNTEDADCWEISIPYTPPKTGKGKGRLDFSKILAAIEDLRKHPGRVKCDGQAIGDQLAELLNEGVDAALKHGYTSIIIDFF